MTNSRVSTETRDELRRSGERFSNKHLSYFNLSLSTSLDKNTLISSSKPQFYKNNISKITRNKLTGNELIIYNPKKSNWKSVLLDNFRMRTPCQHHAMGMKSGYYFIYDNQGVIHVLFNDMQICELSLPDERKDPSLFVYEKNLDQSILLVAGGHIIKGSNTLVILDTVAVFFLNFKELCKLMKREPLFYIKMKYPRMNPTIFKYKKEQELMFFFLGGNDVTKIQGIQKDASRKSIQNLFDSSNMFCETISFKRIRDNIYKSDFEKIGAFIPTEDTLLTLFNAGEGEENQLEKIRFYMDEAAVLRLKVRKNGKKSSYVIGTGKKKNEIWLIDKLDLVEHKLFLVKFSQNLKGSASPMFCKAMFTLMEEELYYFNNVEAGKGMKFKKMHLKGKVGECGVGGCNIF